MRATRLMLSSASDDVEPVGAKKPRGAAWFAWLIKTSLAIFEQALIAGSNFLMNVLVARWLTAEQYGAYAVTFAIYMLLISVNQGVILEPMSVLASSCDELEFREYLGSLLRVQVCIAVAISVCLLAAGLIVLAVQAQNPIAWALVALSIAMPAILLCWLLRAACYVKRAPQIATQSAFMYTVISLVGLYLLGRFAHVSGPLVFILMGLSAAAVTALLWIRLRPNLRSTISTAEQWKKHWDFGRWELSKIGFDWIYQNVSFTLTAGFLGMAQVGALKSMMTLFLPLTQSMAALRRLVLPHLASKFDREKPAETGEAVRKLALIYLAGTALYSAVISIGGAELLRLLYSGKFSQYAYLLPLLSVASLFGIPGDAIEMGLRALRSPRSIFIASCVSAVASVCVTALLTWAFAINGAAWAIVISALASQITMGILFWRKSKELTRLNVVVDPAVDPGLELSFLVEKNEQTQS
jgi:O-antigen/teichoic acid export membrane protein